MKTKKTYEFHVDELLDWDWIFAPENPETGEDIFPVKEDIKKAAKLYNVSPEFLEQVDETFTQMANEIIGKFKRDLQDLYELVYAEQE